MRRFLPIILSVILPSVAGAAVVRIDFGAVATTTTQTGVTWNNLTGTTVGSQIANLADIDNLSTGISLEITGAFRGANSSGTTTSTLFPANATRDSFYGNTVGSGAFPGTFPDGQVTLSGLNASQTYDLLFYASRTGGGNRTTSYSVTDGNGVQVASLNADSTNGSALLTGLVADENGEIVIDVGPGTGNTSAEQFYYLGVLQITTVPEPTSAALLFLSAVPMLRRRRK